MFPVHEEITRDDTLPFMTAELTTGEVIHFSPERIAKIAQTNADTDDDLNPWPHFDDEEFATATKILFYDRQETVESLTQLSPDIDEAIYLLGTSLHTVQDFYSHTNWVELGNQDIVRELGDFGAGATFESSDDIGIICEDSGAGLIKPLIQKITSGYFAGIVSDAHPAGKCFHGGLDDPIDGLNKDVPGRVGHTAARNLAKLASWNFVSKIIRDLDRNDAALCALMGDTTTPGCQLRPTGVTALAGDGAITVTWQPVPNATTYNIYYATESGVSPQTVLQLPGGTIKPVVTSPLLLSGLNNGTKYFVVVTAVVNGQETPPSDEVSATPAAAPENLQAVAGDRKVTLSWNEVPGASSYNIYFATESGISPANVGTISGGATQSNVTSPTEIADLTNGTTYYFVVTATVAAVETPPSSEVSARPERQPDPQCVRIIRTIAGNGINRVRPTNETDGQLATSVSLGTVRAVASAPDGSVVFLELGFYSSQRIRRVTSDGTLATIVGDTGNGFSGDGGPASLAQLNLPQDLDVAPDGSIYVADLKNYRVRKISQDGIISTVAGGGNISVDNSHQGIPATQLYLAGTHTIIALSDGSLILEGAINSGLAWVNTSGLLYDIYYLLVDPVGSQLGVSPIDPLYQFRNWTYINGVLVGPAIHRLDFSLHGRSPVVVYGAYGTTTPDPAPNGPSDIFRLGPDNSAYFSATDQTNLGQVVQRMTANGVITTVAGNGLPGYSGDGGPATDASLYGNDIDIGSDSAIYIADSPNYRIRRAACE